MPVAGLTKNLSDKDIVNILSVEAEAASRPSIKHRI